MKRFISTFFVLFILVACAHAEKGDAYIGVNANYLQQDHMFGVGLKLQQGLSDVVRGETFFNFFPERHQTSTWNVGCNIHYMIEPTEKISFYPIVGFGGMGVVVNEKELELGYGHDHDFRFMINVGLGFELNLSDHVAVNLEGKYQLDNKYNLQIISCGLAYKF